MNINKQPTIDELARLFAICGKYAAGAERRMAKEPSAGTLSGRLNSRCDKY
ncbi:hypothetical protein [Pseudomonas syringae]|uniref:hypothetical protein n=1 Tax=Pseudomonas syringae TaxID=317 RepID=UPI000ADC3159|nr:hypothetical protein [Pseudomonas syringae]